MARNRSEKSPSGDPVVDGYLRACLRVSRCQGNAQLRLELRDLRSNAALRLRPSHWDLLHNWGTPSPRPMRYEDLDHLFGHEDEFKHGTQSK